MASLPDRQALLFSSCAPTIPRSLDSSVQQFAWVWALQQNQPPFRIYALYALLRKLNYIHLWSYLDTFLTFLFRSKKWLLAKNALWSWIFEEWKLQGYFTDEEAKFPKKLYNLSKITQILNNLAGTNISFSIPDPLFLIHGTKLLNVSAFKGYLII